MSHGKPVQSKPQPPGRFQMLGSRLKLRHFLLLNLLIEHGSLRAAARQLDIAQPAVGALLRELEHAVGEELFQRSRTGVTPTDAALLLASRSDVAIEALRVGFDEVASGARPILRIGMVHHAMILHGTAWLAAMQRKAPELQLRVEVAAAPVLLQGVSLGELDCAIARFPSQNLAATVHEPCRIWQLEPDRWSVVGRGTHRGRLSAQELLNHDWVLPGPESQTHHIFRNAFTVAGVAPPRPKLVVDGMQYCVDIAATSDLLTICPESMLRAHAGAAKLKALKTDLAIEAPPLAFVCRAETQKLRSVQALLALVRAASRGERKTGSREA